eukprot:scaffold125902_cov30-Tisochrysis_lutea.AAC.1
MRWRRGEGIGTAAPVRRTSCKIAIAGIPKEVVDSRRGWQRSGIAISVIRCCLRVSKGIQRNVSASRWCRLASTED